MRPTARFCALLAAGATVLHELRYAGHQRAAEGHGYLPIAEALAGLVLAVAVGAFAAALLRARRGVGGAEPAPSVACTWVAATLALLAVHGAQEAAEALVAGGHPLGEGLWTALPLAAAIGVIVALLQRWAVVAIAAAARRGAAHRPRRNTAGRARPPAAQLPRLAPLARHLAGRGPPLVLS
jgi:hypothetical protein